MSNRTVSPLGLAQIEAHEGFQADAVKLSEDRYVVGFGHACQTPPARSLTRQEAAVMLVQDLAPVEQAVNALADRPLTQGQFDALVSFAFSVGVEAFAKSDVLRRVKAGEFAAAACALDAWRKSAVGGEGVVYEALVRRRAAEKALLLSDGAVGAASAWLRPELDHAAAILGAPMGFAPMPAMGLAGEPEQAPANDREAADAPANDDAPLMLTHPVPALAAQDYQAAVFQLRAPQRKRNFEGVALTLLAGVGLLLVVMAGITYFRSAPFGGDLQSTLLLGAPGVAATLAGLFFLTRRARPVFA